MSVSSLAEARAAARAAGAAPSLIEEAEDAARAGQEWGSFCFAWQEDIGAAGPGAGAALRLVHAMVRTPAAYGDGPALVAAAAEATRRAGFGPAADAILARPNSRVLEPIAETFSFRIATGRGGDAADVAALRAIAALAEHVGCGGRIRSTIGKEWGKAFRRLQKGPQPSEEP